MSLAVCEWRKLFRLPALWAFLALCLAFNGLLIASLSPYDRYELQLEIDTGDFLYRVILDRWQADGEGSGQPDSSFTGWNSEPMVYDSQGQLLYSPLFD